MPDRLSTRSDEALERALRRSGSAFDVPDSSRLLDRVELELGGKVRSGRRPAARWLAAALALGIAGVGVVLLARAFGPGPAAIDPGQDAKTEPPPATTQPAPLAGPYQIVWPELSRADAEAAQDVADEGEPEVQWRLDPAEVARRVVAENAFNHEIVSVQEAADVRLKEGRLYYVDTDDGERHRVLVLQPIRQDETGIWSVAYVESRLEIHDLTIGADGATTVTGVGAPPGAQIGYHLRRACPPHLAGSCGYTDELRSVIAGPDGSFRIEDDLGGWMDQPGLFQVWVVDATNERTLFGPVTIRWVPPGAYTWPEG